MRSVSTFPHRPSRSLLIGAGALLTFAALLGCAPDRGPGSVVVTYVLGNNKACEEVGVTNIRATLFKGSFDEPTVSYSDTVPCGEQEVVLDGVAPEVYELRVTGFDHNDVAIFDNLSQIGADRRVEVFEAAESSIKADLTARPAHLSVRWRLGDGGFANCASVGIDRFEITAFQVGGGSVLLRTEIGCETAGNAAGYREVADPDRQLNGILFGEVGIQALAANGSDVGSPALFVFDPVGPGYSVQLGIECVATGCAPE
jgi:hypothetical protein